LPNRPFFAKNIPCVAVVKPGLTHWSFKPGFAGSNPAGDAKNFPL
jgi:hypothetical protein